MARARPIDWKNPDYAPVFKERKWRLEKIRVDHAYWEKSGFPAPSPWDRVHSYYANNTVAWIEDWLFTYDPRLVNKNIDPFVPFMLFPKQQELVEWLDDHFYGRTPGGTPGKARNGLIEKSRDMGVSWITLAWALHKWTHIPGVKIAFGSRKEILVDKMGEPDSLLQKVRIMLMRLPVELRPTNYSERDDAQFMKIMNRENGAIIAGEAGDNIGRGGRTSAYIVDEAAFLENPHSVDAALSNNTNCRFDLSTPNGRKNPFADKRFGGVWDVFTYKWTADPRKDEEWYQEMEENLDAEILAQEVNLDYEASGDETAILMRHVQASRDLYDWLAVRGQLPEPDLDGVGGLDVGAGKAPSVFVPRWGPLVGASTQWTEDGDTTNTAGRARDLALQNFCGVLKYDAPGVGKGVASSLKRMHGVRAQGVNTGSGATRRKWPDGKQARDKFKNLRAELWWVVRDRLRKTLEHWLFLNDKGGQRHEIADLLLLPNDPKLVGQLTVPGYDYTDSGKIVIEKKSSMKTRGVKSPDHADSLILTFAPAKQRVQSGRASGVI